MSSNTNENFLLVDIAKLLCPLNSSGVPTLSEESQPLLQSATGVLHHSFVPIHYRFNADLPLSFG